MGGRTPEGLFILGETELLEHGCDAVSVLDDDGKVAQVGDQNQSVALQITGDLFGAGEGNQLNAGALDLQNAAVRNLPFAQLIGRSALELVRGEQASIGDTRSAVSQVQDAADLRLERLTQFVEKIREGMVVGDLVDAGPGSSNVAQLAEVRFNSKPDAGNDVLLSTIPRSLSPN